MLNFFDKTYQEPPINDFEFGLCDNQDGKVAFTDRVNKEKWTATVNNTNGLDIIFTAIDNGVINNNEYSGFERCDGMLTTDSHLYFIELKNERGNWIQKGISQLESTIKLFNDTHSEIKINYIHRKAYICNKKHPSFHIINNEKNLYFFRKYKFRLDIQATISF